MYERGLFRAEMLPDHVITKRVLMHLCEGPGLVLCVQSGLWHFSTSKCLIAT